MRLMMTASEAIRLANTYADSFMTDEDGTCKLIKSDSEKYDKKCFMGVVSLASVYYACKCGLIDRTEALHRQQDILKGRI